MHIAGLEVANLITVSAIFIAIWLVSYLTSRRVLKQAHDDARRQLELRLEGLTGSLAELEARVAELTRINAELTAATRASIKTAALSHHNGSPPDLPHPNGSAAPPAQVEEELGPETLVVIAAAVTAFLGKKVRIRSAKMLQSPYEIVNPWAQQGRVMVQASHNFREWSHQAPAPSRRGGIRP